jgi:hypothetical protein
VCVARVAGSAVRISPGNHDGVDANRRRSQQLQHRDEIVDAACLANSPAGQWRASPHGMLASTAAAALQNL